MSFLQPVFVLRICKSVNKTSKSLVRFTQTKIQAPRLNPTNKKKSIGESGYILLTLPAFAFGLGVWQIRRREEKLQMIADLETLTKAAAVPLPMDLDELKNMEFRQVSVRGTFDHSKEMCIGPRSNVQHGEGGGGLISDAQSGVNVVTPFKLSDRDLTILVNRGWVPAKKTKPASRPDGQVKGEVELVGIVREEEKRSSFMPKADPKNHGYWLYRDVGRMAEVADTSPIFIDATYPSTVPGGPMGGQTRVTLRNEHMSYIITWFSLSAITAFMWFKKFKRPPPPDRIPLEYFRK
ncbi:hypothetical protein ScPMuIL_011187 [Solemya velum]